MNIADIFVVQVLIPTEYTLTCECGDVELNLCKKYGDAYVDLNSGRTYRFHNRIGFPKVINAIPLSEYYYKIGLRRNNNHDDKESVHKLVKTAKGQGLI